MAKKRFREWLDNADVSIRRKTHVTTVYPILLDYCAWKPCIVNPENTSPWASCKEIAMKCLNMTETEAAELLDEARNPRGGQDAAYFI